MEWKEIAVIYGGQWVGKGIDKATTIYVPDPYDKVVTLVLAVGLPLATRFIRMGKTAETAAIVVGGFLSTRIVDYVEEALTPAVAYGVRK